MVSNETWGCQAEPAAFARESHAQGLWAEVYRGTSLIKNRPDPWDHHRALGTGILWGTRGKFFHMSEVPQ